MTSEFISDDVWAQISRAARRCHSPSHVAVAFIGSGASGMLPLKKGSRLVVDASKRTVKAGLTNPYELERYYKKGVKIYSHKDLHAKVFVFGDLAFVGSANVSKNSKDVLTEAVLRSKVRSIVHSAKKFVEDIGLVEIGREEIIDLQSVYVAPRNVRGISSRRKKSKGLRILHLDEPENVPEDIAEEVDAGEKRARSMLKVRHKSDCIWYGWRMNFREGEHLLFIEDGYMRPPSTVLFCQKLRNITVVHVEVSTQRKKSLKSVKGRLTKQAYKRLTRQGVASETVTRELLKLWD